MIAIIFVLVVIVAIIIVSVMIYERYKLTKEYGLPQPPSRKGSMRIVSALCGYTECRFCLELIIIELHTNDSSFSNTHTHTNSSYTYNNLLRTSHTACTHTHIHAHSQRDQREIIPTATTLRNLKAEAELQNLSPGMT